MPATEVDGGSAGVADFDEFVETVIARGVGRVVIELGDDDRADGGDVIGGGGRCEDGDEYGGIGDGDPAPWASVEWAVGLVAAVRAVVFDEEIAAADWVEGEGEGGGVEGEGCARGERCGVWGKEKARGLLMAGESDQLARETGWEPTLKSSMSG
jgi:hypothetical protein